MKFPNPFPAFGLSLVGSNEIFKRVLGMVVFLMWNHWICFAQGVEVVDSSYFDSSLVREPVRFRIHTFGAAYQDGRLQFFNGYNREIVYANAISGLPLYSDWHLFSATSPLPEYFQAGINVGLTDSSKALRLRLGGVLMKRRDSVAYSGGYFINDTIWGRQIKEEATFLGVSVAALKQSRKLLKCLRLYGGAELEVALTTRSQIELLEYSFDVGEERILDLNEFKADGKPHMDCFLNAVVGLEFILGRKVGFYAEVKSGLGTQLAVKETAFGMARTAWSAGLQVYLWDHDHRLYPPRSNQP